MRIAVHHHHCRHSSQYNGKRRHVRIDGGWDVGLWRACKYPSFAAGAVMLGKKDSYTYFEWDVNGPTIVQWINSWNKNKKNENCEFKCWWYRNEVRVSRILAPKSTERAQHFISGTSDSVPQHLHRHHRFCLASSSATFYSVKPSSLRIRSIILLIFRPFSGDPCSSIFFFTRNRVQCCPI